MRKSLLRMLLVTWSAVASGCGGDVNDSRDQSLAGAGGATTEPSHTGGKTGMGGKTAFGGTTSKGGTSSTTDVSFVMTASLDAGSALVLGASVQVTLVSNYQGFPVGTIFHVELCATDIAETTGELSIRTETQDFGIDRDMTILPEVAAVYEPLSGTACDVLYAGTASSASGALTTMASFVPPVLSPAYDAVRARAFAYDPESKQISFLDEEGYEAMVVFPVDH